MLDDCISPDHLILSTCDNALSDHVWIVWSGSGVTGMDSNRLWRSAGIPMMVWMIIPTQVHGHLIKRTSLARSLVDRDSNFVRHSQSQRESYIGASRVPRHCTSLQCCRIADPPCISISVVTSFTSITLQKSCPWKKAVLCLYFR